MKSVSERIFIPYKDLEARSLFPVPYSFKRMHWTADGFYWKCPHCRYMGDHHMVRCMCNEAWEKMQKDPDAYPPVELKWMERFLFGGP